MTQEERVIYINDLIEDANALASRPYNAQAAGLWVKRIQRFVTSEFGDDAVFERINSEYDEDLVFVFGYFWAIYEPVASTGEIVGYGSGEEAHQERWKAG